MLEFEDALIEPFAAEGLAVPLVKLVVGLPDIDVKVGAQVYKYDRSYPIKGHSAALPRYLQEQVDAGKKPLIVERPDRFYVYLATEA